MFYTPVIQLTKQRSVIRPFVVRVYEYEWSVQKNNRKSDNFLSQKKVQEWVEIFIVQMNVTENTCYGQPPTHETCWG